MVQSGEIVQQVWQTLGEGSLLTGEISALQRQIDYLQTRKQRYEQS
jgi:hypothetical protein